MSAIFPAGRRLRASDIDALTAHFERENRTGTYEAETAYLSLVEGAHDTQVNRLQLRKAGWVAKKRSRGWLNLWKSRLPIVIPKGFTYRVGSAFDSKLHREFRRMQTENFGATKAFNDELDRLNKKLGASLVCVVIYNHRSRAVASGLVANGPSGSFLYSGSVNAKYRGRGLWRLLVSVRQSVAPQTSGQAWLMLTRNPHISKSGQISRRIETFVHPG